jgi:hypothetical protein
MQNPTLMKTQKRKTVLNYLSEQFIGRFTGFVIGLWATRIVSHFFTTRSIHNLWGLTARKTVVSKQTFGNLQWIAAVVIGYLVFEIVFRIIKDKIAPELSKVRLRLFRLLVEKGWARKLRALR